MRSQYGRLHLYVVFELIICQNLLYTSAFSFNTFQGIFCLYFYVRLLYSFLLFSLLLGFGVRIWSLPGGTVVKNTSANAGDTRDMGLIPGLERSPGEGNVNPLQYSCLENPKNRGDWQTTVHGFAKGQTQLRMHAF